MYYSVLARDTAGVVRGSWDAVNQASLMQQCPVSDGSGYMMFSSQRLEETSVSLVWNAPSDDEALTAVKFKLV